MDLTFLIPLKLDSYDRVRNIITVMVYLLTNYQAKVLVKEVDTQQRFEELILTELKKRIQDKDLNRLQYFYETPKKEYFHKTKILNDLLQISTTTVVCNYDTDVILPITSVNKSYELIMSGESDAVYPYGVGVYQKSVRYVEELYFQFLSTKMGDDDIKTLDKCSSPNSSTIGWCQFIRRENYINSFMMNENFAAWGPEDCELFYRLNLLGNKVDRVNDNVYHLEHARTTDSWFSNPHWQENVKLWEWIRRQTKENLIQYYNNQEYIKQRETNVSIQ